MPPSDEVSTDDDPDDPDEFDVYVDHVARRVDVIGELDLATIPRLVDAATSLRTDPPRDYTIDLTAVTFIDAATFGALVGLSHVHHHDGTVLHVIANDRVRRIAGLCGLDGLLAND